MRVNHFSSHAQHGLGVSNPLGAASKGPAHTTVYNTLGYIIDTDTYFPTRATSNESTDPTGGGLVSFDAESAPSFSHRQLSTSGRFPGRARIGPSFHTPKHAVIRRTNRPGTLLVNP